MYKTIVFFFFLKFLFFISIDVFIHIYHKCQNFKYFVFLLKVCRYYFNTTHTSSDVSTISMACRKQRHQSESREHVHRRIIAYLLARVHLAPCTHIKHSQIQYQCAYGCGRSLCCLDPRTLPILWELHRSKSLEFPCTARISSIWNSGDNLKVPSKFSYRIHLIKYTYARDF